MQEGKFSFLKFSEKFPKLLMGLNICCISEYEVVLRVNYLTGRLLNFLSGSIIELSTCGVDIFFVKKVFINFHYYSEK